MSSDREFIDYDSHMPSSLRYPLPQDSLEMYPQPPNIPPQYMHHHRPAMQQQQSPIQPHQIPIQQHQVSIQQHQIPIQQHQHQVPIQQIRYANAMQPGTCSVQSEPPPLNYINRMPSIPVSVNQSRPYMHPQYRAQQMHLQQQEQQRRHQQMLQQNMMSMQNHMVQRQQVRMPTPPMVVSPSGRQVPIQQHRPQQQPQWRFHNVRSLAPAWNNFSESTPPPLMPLECQLSEAVTPAPNPTNEEGVDDFNDFDVTDLLRLTFGEENEYNSRKRKGSRSSGESSPTKKYRRTKAELISDRNEKLLDQCREFYIPLHKNDFPEHVRIFGKNIFRESLPNVPNMKLSPKNIDFYRIRNLGYLVTRKGICFSCLTDQCKFKSYELGRFKEHLSTYHHVEGCGSREGYCKLCEKHCCGFSLIDEMDHILSTHVKSVDKHAMHQILHSHIKTPASFQLNEPLQKFQEDTSNILNNMENGLTIRFGQNRRNNLLNDTFTSNESDSFGPKRSKKGKRSNLLNYSTDEDYNPDVENDEEDEEIESECDANLEDLENESDAELTPDDFIQLSDDEEGEEEEEEEDIVFNDTESESEESKTEKDSSEIPTTENSTNIENKEIDESLAPPAHEELDDIPLYMLHRIKMHQSMKSLQDEPQDTKIDASIVEAVEELLKADGLDKTPKQRKRKKRKSYFARKRTSTPFVPRLNKVYTVESMTDLPSCRVMLKRLEDASESENNDTNIEKSETKATIKINKDIAVPINLPTPPSSENSRDSLPSPPLNKRNEQIRRDIENDSGLSDHSISNKSVINEDSNETIMNEQDKTNVQHLTDSNKNCPDDESEVVQDGNMRLTRKKFKERRESVLNVSTEKMRTRNSVNLHKPEMVNNVGTSIDNKENSGNKGTMNENVKILESPKCTQSPQKRAKIVRKQRFLKKFHKIDNFFQKSDQNHLPEDSKEDDENNDNEVIEIQESPEIPPLDDPPDGFLNNELDNPIDDLTDLPDDSTNKTAPNDKETNLATLRIEEVMSMSQIEDEKNELVTLEELYPWIDDSITKSVQKSKKSIKILKEELTQFSAFKCMRQKCCFFTTDFEKFKTHTESYDGGHNFCSFCLYNSSTCQELFEHVENNHMHDRYQCNMCMYRASEKAYVEWHQKRFHVYPSGKILKSPTQILMKSVRTKLQEQLENENRKKYVLPYRCKTSGCDKEFYNKNNYKSHLKQESDDPALSQYIDEICNQLLSLDQTRIKTFKEGFNQCLYCEYGSDNNSDINKHMTDNHPNQLGFICRRLAEAEQICVDETKDNENETLEDQTRVEYIGISSFKVKLFKGNVDSLTAADEVCAGDGEKLQSKPDDSAEKLIDTKFEISINNSDNSELNNSTNVKPSTLPIISEIIHIDNF